MMFCKECVKWVLSTHVDELRVEWREWDKMMKDHEYSFKYETTDFNMYEEYLPLHRPIKVSSEVKFLVDIIIKLTEEVRSK